MFIAVPLIVWSALSLMEANAWRYERAIDASIATQIPQIIVRV